MTGIAVVDVETTGLFANGTDRVIELAAVVLGPDGSVIRDFVTLVNPERDIGPTRIHQLTSRDIIRAPRFGEIAGEFLSVLSGCVAIAGHNVRFDHSFLEMEFNRMGYALPDVPTLCTMHLAGGGSLRNVCESYGITFEGEAHSALYDARATARLLAWLLADAPRIASDIWKNPTVVWPQVPVSGVKPVSRDAARAYDDGPPTYLQQLLAQEGSVLLLDDEDTAISSYVALLNQVLEDRIVDEQEERLLVDLATKWGLSGSRICEVHRDYLWRLVMMALADDVITTVERSDLLQVASLLGIGSQKLDEIVRLAVLRRSQVPCSPPVQGSTECAGDLAGRTVCFTGECQCLLNGRVITREVAATVAESREMKVVESVTKKLDILVVADPFTQSGKAKKARQYGIRIICEPVFWGLLGLTVE